MLISDQPKTDTWRRRGYHIVTVDGSYVTDPLANYTKREAMNMAARDPHDRDVHVIRCEGPPSLT